MSRALAHWGRRALDILLPPRCLRCGEAVDEQGRLCLACWSGIRFVEAPLCGCCGVPLDFDLGPGVRCGACLAHPPAFDRARTVMGYDEASRDLILRLKHADHLEGAPHFARWLARAGAELVQGADAIVPVPLHWRRLVLRRYNQSAVLGMALARVCGVPCRPDLLLRLRPTASQGHLGRSQRARNVRGAFAVRGGQPVPARIVLLDDVLTTGATVEACARTLKRAGAVNVDVLTLARVIRPMQVG
ncbi:double zinc ribbon domain-containing protein [Zavarzinia sp. CC-PAN008]|uniref:double zinc ribbon domain-containing protein n=1 Tax=Zavarzinia sp. CC-PAN008 TaxID=3243332 RepID=UPI003F747C04